MKKLSIHPAPMVFGIAFALLAIVVSSSSSSSSTIPAADGMVITVDEATVLENGYKAIEKGAADVLEFAESMPNNERGVQLREMAKLNVLNAAKYRLAFIDALISDDVIGGGGGSDPTDPVDPPVVDPPTVDPPVIDPPATADAGCRLTDAELMTWTFQAWGDAGRPDELPEYGSGAMEAFRFTPSADDLYTGQNGWAVSGLSPPYVAEARDFVVDGYKPWASNRKGVRQELVEYATIRGVLRTGQHIEHADYRGGEGGGGGEQEYQVARRFVLWERTPGAAFQHTTRDKHLHGGWSPTAVPALECSDPAICFDPAGPVEISDSIARRCAVEFPAAVVSMHAPQRWDSQGRMPHAYQGAIVQRTLFDNASTVQDGDGTYATLLLVAGKKWIRITDCAFLRDESVYQGGQNNRSLLKFGDQYHPGHDLYPEFDGAPAVDPGGTIEVSNCSFWTAEGGIVEILALNGTTISWTGCTLLEGSKSVTLMLNGAPLGSVAEDHVLTVGD